MANYSSYKVYIEQTSGTFDVEVIKQNIRKLQQEHRIIYDVHAYICIEKQALELRYSAKWFPEIEEVFTPDKYDIYLVHSDECGAKDSLYYISSKQSRIIDEIDFRIVFYEFDAIEVYGDVEQLKENLTDIFGLGCGYHREHKEFLHLSYDGVYTANNYFCDYDRGDIKFEFVESLPLIDDFSESMFCQIIWNYHDSSFMENFYRKVFGYCNNKGLFPYLQSIKFKYKGRVTNIIERTDDDEYCEWRHTASNNFQNLMNTNFILYTKQK